MPFMTYTTRDFTKWFGSEKAEGMAGMFAVIFEPGPAMLTNI
jgi:hypothetical protein